MGEVQSCAMWPDAGPYSSVRYWNDGVAGVFSSAVRKPNANMASLLMPYIHSCSLQCVCHSVPRVAQ